MYRLDLLDILDTSKMLNFCENNQFKDFYAGD